MRELESESHEIDRLLEIIFDRFGYDFRSYSEASLKRRIHLALTRQNLSTVHELSEKIARDTNAFSMLLNQLTVTVTEMFRDAQVFKYLRDQVFPYLKTYPELKIWHAGCSTGEEVYSLAILLMEAGLYERCLIYGTDINPRALQKARDGILSGPSIEEATARYTAAGGVHSFSKYYTMESGVAVLDPRLKKNLVFSDHNLVTDSKFGEMNLILCRNVLIYFSLELQNRVLALLWESLGMGGFLCLGSKERLDSRRHLQGCRVMSTSERVYQKKV